MTQRCSLCDIAHDETDGRCPTDLEYERGYRNGMNQKAKELAPLEQRLAAAEARAEHAEMIASSLQDILDAKTRPIEEVIRSYGCTEYQVDADDSDPNTCHACGVELEVGFSLLCGTCVSMRELRAKEVCGE